jgi:VCBS repeat-containing protein
VNSTRRRPTSLIALALAVATAAIGCGGDGVVLPSESGPAKIAIVDGNEQKGLAGSKLADALVAKVTDSQGRPVEGQTVAFTVDVGGGSVAPGSVTTGADGLASTDWTLGAGAGQQRVVATVQGDNVPAGLVVAFTASAMSGSGARLEIVSGDNQSAPVGSALPDSLVVRVTDSNGNPVAGVQVDWTTDGAGGVSPSSGVSDDDGLAAAERVLGTSAGTHTTQAASAGIDPVSFTSTAVPANPTALVLVSGDAQSGAIGSVLAAPLVVRLQDDNGNGIGGKSITWVVSPGGGSVDPTNVVTDPNGLAGTVWTVGSTVGQKTVTAIYSGLPPVTFTANVGASSATRVAFTRGPQNTAAGASLTPPLQVSILDAGGNTVTTATDAVTLSLDANPTGATLSGTVTVNAINGVASFPGLSLDKVGSGYTLAASAAGLTGDISAPFDILPGTANRLVFITPPTNRVVGQAFSPAIQVQVQDAAGNPVLSANNAITLASSVAGTLTGNNTKGAVAGTATFGGLSIDAAGTGYTLTALASGLTSATSDPFDILPGSTKIDITGQTPAASLPGQSFSVSYDVDPILPAAGNLNGNVTVTVGSATCTGNVTVFGGGSCSLTLPDPGSYQVTATYGNDPNFAASTSAPATHVVKSPTSLTITGDAPDPSTVGSTVSLQWTLSSSGAAPITGNVTVTVNGNAGTCSAPAALGSGSCNLIVTAPGTRTITAAYAGDGNYGPSTDTESHVATAPNQAPTADDDGPYDVLEDGTLTVPAGNGVLNGDSDPEGSALTAVKDSDPQHGTLTLNADGSFTYTPAADFSGDDSFTYHASDGALSSAPATVTINVTQVNDAPSFTKGADQTVSPLALTQTVPGWATGISAGPGETGQTLQFQVSTNDDSQFFNSVPPQISSNGTLTYTPNPLSGGATVTVTVRLHDDGGTANGGVDTSPDQTFTITIQP